MHTPFTERRHVPPAVQHCAAMMLRRMPAHVVVSSCTPGCRQPRTLAVPLVPRALPLRTSTPPMGMVGVVAGDKGNGGERCGGGGTGGSAGGCIGASDGGSTGGCTGAFDGGEGGGRDRGGATPQLTKTWSTAASPV